MKKIVLGISMLAIAGAGIFVACKKTASINQNTLQTGQSKSNSTSRLTPLPITTNIATSFQEYKMQIDAVGIAHNNFLENQYAYFKSLKENNNYPHTNADFDNVALTQLSTFFQAEYNINTVPFHSINTINTPPLSPEVQNILNEVYSEIDKFSDMQINIGEFTSRLEQLKSLSYSILSEQDRYIAGVSVAVAQYSLNYWVQNNSKWDETFKTPEAKIFAKPSEPQVSAGTADLKGAVKGAAGGAVAGSAAGGIGAIPGAIVGAAAGASVASLKQALIDKGAKWLDWIPFI